MSVTFSSSILIGAILSGALYANSLHNEPDQKTAEKHSDNELANLGFQSVADSRFFSAGKFVAKRDARGIIKLYVNYSPKIDTRGPLKINTSEISEITLTNKDTESEAFTLLLNRANGRLQRMVVGINGGLGLLPARGAKPPEKSIVQQLSQNPDFTRDTVDPNIFHLRRGKIEIVIITNGNKIVKLLRSVDPKIQERLDGAKIKRFFTIEERSNPDLGKSSFLEVQEGENTFIIGSPRTDGELGGRLLPPQAFK